MKVKNCIKKDYLNLILPATEFSILEDPADFVSNQKHIFNRPWSVKLDNPEKKIEACGFICIF